MNSCRSFISGILLRRPWPFLMLSRKPSSLMCMSCNTLIAPACVVPDSHPSWNTHERLAPGGGRVGAGRVVVALPSPLGPAAAAQLTRSGSLGLSNFRGWLGLVRQAAARRVSLLSRETVRVTCKFGISCDHRLACRGEKRTKGSKH